MAHIYQGQGTSLHLMCVAHISQEQGTGKDVLGGSLYEVWKAANTNRLTDVAGKPCDVWKAVKWVNRCCGQPVFS